MHSITYTLSDNLMIFGIHIYQAKTVCHVHEWLLPLQPIDLKRGKLVDSITHLPFEIF